MRSINGELAKIYARELHKPSFAFDVGHVGVLAAVGGGGSGWDFEDNFDSDKSWAESGSCYTIDYTTNNRIDFAYKRRGVDEQVYKDLQDADALNGSNASDTAYVLQIHQEFTSDSTSTAHNQQNTIGLSSSNSGHSAAQDAINLWMEWNNGGGTYKATNSENGDLTTSGHDNTSDFATALALTDDNDLQEVRLSSTSADIELLTVEKETITVDANTLSLRYILGTNRNVATQANTLNGWLDTVKFADGVTTPP